MNMQLITRSKEDLIKLAETKQISPTQSINILETFDYSSLQHKDLEVRQLACLCLLTLLSAPRFSIDTWAADQDWKGHGTLKSIYVPFVFKDDVIYIVAPKDLRNEIDGFHSWITKVITKSPGCLQKKLFCMVGIKSKEELISSFDRNEPLTKQIAQMEDPLSSWVFCSGADFWRNHADFQYCQIGAGEEDLPLSTDDTQSICSSKSNSDTKSALKRPNCIKKAKFVISSRNQSHVGPITFGKLVEEPSSSNFCNTDRNPDSSKSNSSKNISSRQIFRVKKCAQSSFANSPKAIKLGPKSCDIKTNLEGSKDNQPRTKCFQKITESKLADVLPVICARSFKQGGKRKMSPTLPLSPDVCTRQKRSRFSLKGQKGTYGPIDD